ncbi:amino acid ABC transporter permease [Mycobacterium syngnathidarum]|uniref:Glutamate ABC transporter permease n=1 Tax=Mycobacterium syngnathidarum TaxID=1908205 RepID=A0A1S1KJX9_9MYCO|nr:amino acid ABC transporter permease [Mycobacterium syngnathidarum]OHU06755.1 glutamate ABC transporter permease [Mycobacterium syngnathidarum]
MSASVLFDAPGPRARVRNNVLTVLAAFAALALIAFVLFRLWEKDQLQPAKWKPFLTSDPWVTYVLPGIEGTLTAAAISIVLALVLGLMLGIGRLAPIAPIRWTCAVIVEFFRAVPVLIMMLFAFFLYSMLDFGTFDEFLTRHVALAGVVTGLTLYNGAVIAEIVRAGVHSLPRGQQEAAWSLGLTWTQTMRLILLPQAITAMLPVLVSQLVVVLKDTAIGYQITFVEMVRQGTNIGSAYGNILPALIVIAILMISVNMALSSLATRIEQRLRRSSRGPAPLEPEEVEQEGAPGAQMLHPPRD